VHPFEAIDLSRAHAIEKSTRYYNTEIHKGSFALPNFLKHRLKGVVANA
jgi:spermidine synthase